MILDPSTGVPYYTIDQLKDWLRDRVDEGCHCPVCGQLAKVYRRKITSTMARALIALHRVPLADTDDGYVHLPSLLSTVGITTGGDTTKAAYWGLIEPMPDVVRDDGSPRVGYWRLTNLGRQYVQGWAKVPKYAHIYDGRCLGMDETEHAGIEDALGTHFNYTDLMEGH